MYTQLPKHYTYCTHMAYKPNVKVRKLKTTKVKVEFRGQTLYRFIGFSCTLKSSCDYDNKIFLDMNTPLDGRLNLHALQKWCLMVDLVQLPLSVSDEIKNEIKHLVQLISTQPILCYV